MPKRITILAAVVATLASLLLPAVASADSEWGRVRTDPWSGSWWPMLSTQVNLYDDGGPLEKYDSYVKATTGTAGGAKAWERANHATDNEANSWWGHCHAWSAASILTPQPPTTRTVEGIAFDGNDLRGLVTELYYSPKLNWLAGTRVDDKNDTTSAAYKDVAPAWMDWLLRYYVRYYKYPFVMDINANAEVWNFPAYAYSRSSTANADGSESVTTTVWYANPKYGVTGTSYFSRTYTYTLKSGTLGTWTGDSVKDHPDFAWLPTGRNAMPHVDAAKVGTIVGQQV